MLAGYFFSGFIALASATVQQDTLFATLLKRQQPGTPAYACHEACGTAVALSKGADPCALTEFTTKYNDCLKCAGPDNVNIWRYYGGTLSKVGAACGLDTQPQAGASPTQVESSQGVSSSLVVVSSGTAVLVSESSIAASTTPSLSSSQAIDASASSSSTSDAVSPSTGTSTASAPAEVSTNAAAAMGIGGVDSVSGVFGAIFVAALFGM